MFGWEHMRILETLSDNFRKSVYRGRDEKADRTVILKVLKSEFAGPDEVLRFKQEYRLLAELAGKVEGVIAPLGLEELNGYYVMTLEDIGGQSLKALSAEDRNDRNRLLKLMIRVVEILGAVHDRRVIHKDIKPSNIVWNRERDEVQLIDFDLAVKVSREKREFAGGGILEGSLNYVSPEQTGRINRTIDYRSDYYSLGVVMYEIFTGVKPFESTDMLDQIYAVIAREALPPHRIAEANVPRALSDLIMKLMEKSPEDRYQSAYGIKADLLKCLEGQDEFLVGAEDRRSQFSIPQGVYGRERELETLHEAFRRSLNGPVQIMLLSGEPGVGKTALIHELQPAVSREQGWLAEGKFDQYTRTLPYSAVLQAFRPVVASIVAGPDGEEKRQAVEALKRKLGGNAALMTALIPELETLLGPQQPVPALNPSEEVNRFYATFGHLIDGLTAGGRPLVLFLDDVQWADLTSLQLVAKLALNPDLRRLLLICAYRSQEMREEHPLSLAIAEIASAREIVRLPIPALGRDAVERLVADAFGAGAAEAAELAELLLRRTGGNALFVSVLLKELHRTGGIRFDEATGRWTWQLAELQRLDIGDDVVHFLMSRLHGLPEGTRRALQTAAAIGSQFDYRMLSLIADMDRAELARSLSRAVEEELILPLDANYPLLAGLSEEGDEEVRSVPIAFRFRHDRIQQAFYQLVAEAEAPRLHLAIGRLMLRNLPPEEAENYLPDIVTHIDKGIGEVTDRAERRGVAQLNLRAARQSKAVFAYATAYEFLDTARSLVDERDWQGEDRLAAGIHRLFAECGYLTRHVDEADEACGQLLARAGRPFEAAQIYEMQAGYYFYLGRMKESIAAGRTGLRLMGVRIPEKVGMAAVLAEFLKIKNALRGVSVEEIWSKPDMTDENVKLTMRLLINIFPPAFISGETSLFGLVVLRMAGLTLRFGNAPESALAFIGYAMLLSGFGDVKGAFAFGRLGIRINDKLGDQQWRGAAHVLYTLFCHTWTEPWDTLQDWYGKSVEASLQTGDLLYMAHSCYYMNLWNPSLDIQGQLQEAAKQLVMIENTRYREALYTARLARQQWRNLAGELKDRRSFDGEDFSEAEYLETLEAAQYYSGIAIYYIYKMKLLYTYEDDAAAMAFLTRASGVISTLSGAAFMEEYALYAFLILARQYPTLGPREKRRAKRKMGKELARVARWAKGAPDTFAQHEWMLRAEWARLFGTADEAARCYGQAIEAAEHGSFVRYKALANELAAKFYAGRGLGDVAAFLLKQAVYYYSVWGAKEKVAQLGEQYPELLLRVTLGNQPPSRTLTDSTGSIDLNSILMASQAISREIDLNSLLRTLMEIVLKNAGAQRGCILMKSGKELMVEGEYYPDEELIGVHVRENAVPDQLPLSVLKYVEETGNSVIYHDAYSETPFVNDPYMIAHRPKSMVCMPLVNQSKLVAIIYLENNLVAGLFTKERMRIINLLSREMVYSLENASLYRDLENSEQKYRELVNHMMDGLFIAQESLLVYVNEVLAQMVGARVDELTGRSFLEIIPPSEKDKVAANHRKRVNGDRVPSEYETRLHNRRTGKELIVLLKVVLVNYLGKPAVQGTVKDITERKQVEEELREHKEHLEELVIERTRELEHNNQELGRYIQLIETMSVTDELTGLYNRRYFNTVFQRTVEQMTARNEKLTYIMMDIDFYKKYNDTYGHYEGDNVLRRLGSLIREQVRGRGDHVFRLGGEEFGIILTGLSAEESLEIAESIRGSVEALNITHQGSPDYGRLTISVGVAILRVNGINEEQVYKLADEALYRSKAEGRNRVTLLEG